jgi:hypothetical protein
LEPIAIAKHECRLAEPAARRVVVDTMCHEAVQPKAHCARGHGERRLRHLANARPSLSRARIGEERDQAAGTSLCIAIVEMVCGGVVEVDGLLHQPQAEDPRIEVHVLLRVASDGADVMNAVYRVHVTKSSEERLPELDERIDR